MSVPSRPQSSFEGPIDFLIYSKRALSLPAAAERAVRFTMGKLIVIAVGAVRPAVRRSERPDGPDGLGGLGRQACGLEPGPNPGQTRAQNPAAAPPQATANWRT